MYKVQSMYKVSKCIKYMNKHLGDFDCVRNIMKKTNFTPTRISQPFGKIKRQTKKQNFRKNTEHHMGLFIMILKHNIDMNFDPE